MSQDLNLRPAVEVIDDMFSPYRKRIAALEAEWRRECDDGDKIVEKLGLTVEQARTEGGSLKVAFICNHIQETLDALADADGRRIALFNENATLRARVAELEAKLKVAEKCFIGILDCEFLLTAKEASKLALAKIKEAS